MTKRTMMVLLVMGVLTGALWGPAYGEVLNRYGGDPGTTWDAVNWQTLGGLNDAVNEKITPGLDFVGDTTNGGAFWASNDSYLFFRMRVDETMEDSTNDTLMIMVDKVGYGPHG